MLSFIDATIHWVTFRAVFHMYPRGLYAQTERKLKLIYDRMKPPVLVFLCIRKFLRLLRKVTINNPDTLAPSQFSLLVSLSLRIT